MLKIVASNEMSTCPQMIQEVFESIIPVFIKKKMKYLTEDSSHHSIPTSHKWS
jgi:hypothetical protein